MGRILLPGKTPIKRWVDNAAALRAVAVPQTDPNFANVALLMHFDSPLSPSTSLVDSSSHVHTITSGTSSGEFNVLTTQKKFGAASLFGLGTGGATRKSDRVTLIPGALTNANFTLEWWVRTGTTGGVFSMQPDNVSWNGFGVDLISGGFRIWNAWNAGGFLVNSRSFTGGTDTGDWNHMSLNRTSQVWTGTMNGEVLTQTAGSGDGVPGSKNFNRTIFQIGDRLESSIVGSLLNGWIDELRLTRGIARYTGAHAVPTGPFPNSA
jgi:hypothetical protein